MNKSKILLSSAVSMIVLSASNLSLAAAPMLMGSYGAYGPYVGIQAGMGGMDTKKLSDVTKGSYAPYTEDVNDWDFFTGRIFAGYLWSQDALSYGLELGAMMYPKNKYSVTDSDLIKYQYKGYTVDALGVVKYSLANNFYIFGKAGVAYVTQEYKQETNPTVTVFEETERKFLPEVAAGVGYDFNNMGIDVTYAHIFGKSPKEYSDAAGIAPASDDLYKKVASINAVMLSFIYHIGK